MGMVSIPLRKAKKPRTINASIRNGESDDKYSTYGIYKEVAQKGGLGDFFKFYEARGGVVDGHPDCTLLHVSAKYGGFVPLCMEDKAHPWWELRASDNWTVKEAYEEYWQAWNEEIEADPRSKK
jgi:hypothetical protein